MARWKNLLKKAFEAIVDSGNEVCMVCGGKVSQAAQCEACGVTACPECRRDGTCPNCGDPV